MLSSDPAFGRILRQLVDLGVITINTEPLDAAIERRLKQFWESTTCPRCGNPSIYTWESSDRFVSEISLGTLRGQQNAPNVFVRNVMSLYKEITIETYKHRPRMHKTRWLTLG